MRSHCVHRGKSIVSGEGEIETLGGSLERSNAEGLDLDFSEFNRKSEK